MNALSDAVEQYLALRRGLGFKLKEHERALRSFAAYMCEHGVTTITTQLALDWAQLPRAAQQAHRARRLGIVRDFAKYFTTVDSNSEIPPRGILKNNYIRPRPYIYSEDELIALIDEARRLTPAAGLRPWTYATLFGLLCATGMRVSEAIALDDNDLDQSNAIIKIRQSKFGKTRHIPVLPSTQEELRSYVARRTRASLPLGDGSFFVSDRGTRLTACTVRGTFVTASCHIGLRVRSRSHGYGPRLHDIRHTFAVRALIQCYQAGGNVQRHLPALAAYLGHTNISDSYWYLSAVPELLDMMNERLDRYLENLP